MKYLAIKIKSKQHLNILIQVIKNVGLIWENELQSYMKDILDSGFYMAIWLIIPIYIDNGKRMEEIYIDYALNEVWIKQHCWNISNLEVK
jgi:hypothetical protein